MKNLFENNFLNTTKEGRKQTYNINDASLLKRIMAGLVDFILTFVLAFGFYVVARRITHYQDYQDQLSYKYIEHGMYVEDETNYTFEFNDKKYRTLDEINDAEAYKIANEALQNDADALKIYRLTITTLIADLSVSALLAILLLEFAFPLFIKNGRTIGGFFLHIGLISNQNVQIKPIQLFARAVVGRYACETMFPLIGFFMFGIWPALIVLMLQVTLLFCNGHHQLLRNVVSNTVTVDHDTQYYAINLDDLRAKINAQKGIE